jgi:hypothetical protein
MLNYTSPGYTGPAIKLGSGVLGGAALEAAARLADGYRLVGGTCPTVGIAGGYSLGGGHGPLSSMYGLAADNVLEWDVVLADGTRTVASPARNADLFWAMTGGGGGTYAVAVAMTARLHRGGAVSGAQLAFNVSGAPSADAFWGAVEAALAVTPGVVDSGAYMLTAMTSVGATLAVTAPGQSATQVRARLRGLVAYLDAQRIAYSLDVTTHASYYEHFDRYYGPLPDGQWSASELFASRILPRSIFEAQQSSSSSSSSLSSSSPSISRQSGNLSSESAWVAEPTRQPSTKPAAPATLKDLISFYRLAASEAGWVVGNLAFKASPPPPAASGSGSVATPFDGNGGHGSGDAAAAAASAAGSANSVHPAWRTAASLALVTVPWDWRAPPAIMAARLDRLTRVIDTALVRLAPQSGAYLNEANAAQSAEWLRREAFGPNLPRLCCIKDKYDPAQLFWAPAVVGSEAWTPDGEGRLCRSR